jgi:hypothetical protein
MSPRAATATLGVLALLALAVLAVRWDDPGAAIVAIRSTSAPAAASAPPVTTISAASDTAASDGATSTSTSSTIPPRTSGATSARRATAASSAAAARPAISPAALHRPKPGAYAIEVRSGGTGTRGTLIVDPEQWQRRAVGDDRRSELLVWDRDGALLASSGAPGADGACEWDHEALEVPFDLAAGRAWSSRATCDSTIRGRVVHLERIETAEVEGTARTKLDGGTIDTWVIDRRVVLSIVGEGISTVTDATSTELFAPDLGLSVFTASRTKVPQPDGSTQTVDATEELLERAPSPTR